MSNTNQSSSSDTNYYKTRIFGLKVVVGDPDPSKGEVAPKRLEFMPYWTQEPGVAGTFRVGYLETDNGAAIKKLDNHPDVESISKSDYEKATKPKKEDEEKASVGSKVIGSLARR